MLESQAQATQEQRNQSDAVLLQSLKSLVTQAQERPSFDLWHGLSELVAAETTRRQTGQRKQHTQQRQKQWDWPQPRAREQNNGNKQQHDRRKPWQEQKPTSSKRNAQDANGWGTIKWKPRVVDWQSTLTDQIVIVHGPDQYAKAMEEPDNQEAAFVGIATNAGEYQEMIDLAGGERSAMCTLLMSSQIAPEEEDPSRQVIRIPGTLRQGIQFRACWLTSFAQGSPTLRRKQTVDLQQSSRSQAKSAQNSI